MSEEKNEFFGRLRGKLSEFGEKAKRTAKKGIEVGTNTVHTGIEKGKEIFSREKDKKRNELAEKIFIQHAMDITAIEAVKKADEFLGVTTPEEENNPSL